MKFDTKTTIKLMYKHYINYFFGLQKHIKFHRVHRLINYLLLKIKKMAQVCFFSWFKCEAHSSLESAERRVPSILSQCVKYGAKLQLN